MIYPFFIFMFYMKHYDHVLLSAWDNRIAAATIYKKTAYELTMVKAVYSI